MQNEINSEISFFFFFFGGGGQFTMAVFHLILYRYFAECGFLGPRKITQFKAFYCLQLINVKIIKKKNNYLQEIIHVHELHCHISSYKLIDF